MSPISPPTTLTATAPTSSRASAGPRPTEVPAGAADPFAALLLNLTAQQLPAGADADAEPAAGDTPAAAVALVGGVEAVRAAAGASEVGDPGASARLADVLLGQPLPFAAMHAFLPTLPEAEAVPEAAPVPVTDTGGQEAVAAPAATVALSATTTPDPVMAAAVQLATAAIAGLGPATPLDLAAPAPEYAPPPAAPDVTLPHVELASEAAPQPTAEAQADLVAVLTASQPALVVPLASPAVAGDALPTPVATTRSASLTEAAVEPTPEGATADTAVTRAPSATQERAAAAVATITADVIPTASNLAPVAAPAAPRVIPAALPLPGDQAEATAPAEAAPEAAPTAPVLTAPATRLADQPGVAAARAQPAEAPAPDVAAAALSSAAASAAPAVLPVAQAPALLEVAASALRLEAPSVSAPGSARDSDQATGTSADPVTAAVSPNAEPAVTAATSPAPPALAAPATSPTPSHTASAASAESTTPSVAVAATAPAEAAPSGTSAQPSGPRAAGVTAHAGVTDTPFAALTAADGRTAEHASAVVDEASLPQAAVAEVARAIEEAAQSRLQSTRSVTVRLHPEGLGEMRIEVAVAQGRVSTAFHVDPPRLEGLLGQLRDDLSQSLASRGLQLEHFNVYADTGGAADRGAQPFAAEAGQGEAVSASLAWEQPTPWQPPARIGGGRDLDVYV